MENSPFKPRLGYKNLEAWQKASLLADEVARAVSLFRGAAAELRDQMISSAESVASNIAEAEGRATNKDALRIYFIARGSLWELDSQINLCVKRGLFSAENGDKLMNLVGVVGRLVGGVIRMRRRREEELAARERKRRRG
jgi:four helix bundle protein